MWGADHQQSGMFSYISAERRVPEDHPLRAIRAQGTILAPDLAPILAPDPIKRLCGGAPARVVAMWPPRMFSARKPHLPFGFLGVVA